MNRALFSGRYLVITIIVIVLLTRLLGLWDWHKRDHNCLDNDHFQFTAKVQIVQWGSLRLFSYPLIHDCPAPDQYPNDGSFHPLL